MSRAWPLFAALLSLACAPRARIQGVLLTDEQGRMELVEPEGKATRVHLTPTSAALTALEECTVAVTGPKIGRGVWARDWEVLTAADGSAPFVGRLELRGSNVILHDRQTGSMLMLSPESAAPLAPFDGDIVLVIGFVEGPNLIRVMGWRLLEDLP
ncbi:hypothetical protein L6R46_10005 [Myxococcota bacterium]|nr:hypothetical protein [Myxococcota bacterium]